MEKRRNLRQIFSDAWRLLLKDIKSSKWAVVLIAVYFVFGKWLFGSLCPMVMITGFPCPGCGLTRAGLAFFKLDFYNAWVIHPFIFPIVLLVFLFCFNRYILLKKEMSRLKWCGVFVLCAMIFFYIWRMFWYFPGEPPMSYYRYNLLKTLLNLQ
ncbi:DUF2752 domain-containing protein [Lachnospiraceae bacterium 42-17]